MSLLSRLRMLGSSEIVVLPAVCCPKGYTKAAKLHSSHPAAKSKNRRWCSGLCDDFLTASLVAPWDSTEMSLLYQQGY